MNMDAGLPWAVVVGLITYSGWLHLELRKLHVAKAELTQQVKALAESGTDGTIMRAIDEIRGMFKAINDRVEADYQTVAICLIQLSNGKPISPADLQRKR